ncbi:hypothetical protein DPMN_194573 [Dreissena polymorpha]|uniref:Uncharacterized protein n=1 Tax=Dreissena polymorpha TaxID=45954 RepID=A0A9D3Y330_DREPO|nr:hypothetical protein DPMN_194573 [Dreissena polymorpha]
MTCTHLARCDTTLRNPSPPTPTKIIDFVIDCKMENHLKRGDSSPTSCNYLEIEFSVGSK